MGKPVPLRRCLCGKRTAEMKSAFCFDCSEQCWYNTGPTPNGWATRCGFRFPKGGSCPRAACVKEALRKKALAEKRAKEPAPTPEPSWRWHDMDDQTAKGSTGPDEYAERWTRRRRRLANHPRL